MNQGLIEARPSTIDKTAESFRDKILRKCGESVEMKEKFFEKYAAEIEELSKEMAKRFAQGNKLLTMGNGGSLCDALHFAVEFTHPIIEKRAAFPAVSLMTDIATMTAIGNDADFSRVFVDQLRLLGQPGDMLLAVSTSGKSPNLIYALEEARRRGLLTIAWSGKDGGRFPDLADYSFHRSVIQHSPHPGSARDVGACSVGFDPHRSSERKMSSRRSADRSAETARRQVSLAPVCPIPITNYNEIVLAHGSGGKLSHQLMEKMVLPQFRNELLEPLHDGAIFSIGGQRVAFSTDSYVVSPIFFPGGDIGKLAVHGTVNDLAMCGARPLYLSVGFILEEGTPMEDFWRVVQSMREAADAAGVMLVTGDTKVVDRGKADKIFINTSGIGVDPRRHQHRSEPCAAQRQNHSQWSNGGARDCNHVHARGARIRK